MQLPLAQQRLQDTQVISRPVRRLFVGAKADACGLLAPAREKKIHAPILIRFWHLASLDAPTVAFVWCAAFAWASYVSLPAWVLALIPLGVWSAYVADRLLDARVGIKSPDLDQLQDRHVFHWRHRRVLIPVAFASAVTAICIICKWMPRSIREHDSLLAAASLAYFARVHSKRATFAPFSKEFLVGVIFTLGCVLPTWSRAQFSNAAPIWPLLMLTAVFGVLAWLNCVAIDHWESHNTRNSSIAQLGTLLSCAFSICAFLLMRGHHSRPAGLAVCAAISALIMALLDRYRDRLTPVTLRSVADIVLLTPALPLVFVTFSLK